jgi:hypothetical protein
MNWNSINAAVAGNLNNSLANAGNIDFAGTVSNFNKGNYNIALAKAKTVPNNGLSNPNIIIAPNNNPRPATKNTYVDNPVNDAKMQKQLIAKNEGFGQGGVTFFEVILLILFAFIIYQICCNYHNSNRIY